MQRFLGDGEAGLTKKNARQDGQPRRWTQVLDGLRKTRSAYTRSRSGYREVTLSQRAQQLASVVVSGAHTVLNFTLSVPGRLRDFAALSGTEKRQVYAGWWSVIKKEGRHYWVRSSGTVAAATGITLP